MKCIANTIYRSKKYSAVALMATALFANVGAAENTPPLVTWAPLQWAGGSQEGTGLSYAYYEGEFRTISEMMRVMPIMHGINNTGIDISNRRVNDRFGYRFTGYITIDASGDYEFYTRSDDGSRLLIDGNVVVNNDGLHGVQEKSGLINLSMGQHQINVDYFELTGGEVCEVFWKRPGGNKETIPVSLLKSAINGMPQSTLAQQPTKLFWNSDGNGTVSVQASDVDQGVAEVRFYIDGTLYSSANESPYAAVINGLSGGVHAVVAQVVDLAGATTNSLPLSIHVNQDGPITYDGFKGSMGTVNRQYIGVGWSGSWYCQNDVSLDTGYAIVEPGLHYNNLSVEGGRMMGGYAYTTVGRLLDTGANGVWSSVCDASGLLANDGSAIWMSFLVRKERESASDVKVIFHNSGIAWYAQTPILSVGTFGSLSMQNNVQYWALRLGNDAVVTTGVPVVVGQTECMVLSMRWSNGQCEVKCYQNPSSLGGSAPDLPNAVVSSPSSAKLRSVAFYGTNASASASVDEIRVGLSYGAVTPVQAPIAELRGYLPPTSRVSPVCFEADASSAAAVAVSVNGSMVPTFYLSDSALYANLQLQPLIANSVHLSSGGEEWSGLVTWEETRMDEENLSLALRRGDSLLLRSLPGATLYREDGYDEKLVGEFGPTGLMIVDFPSTGNFTLTAKTGNQLPCGSIHVTAYACSITHGLACELGFERMARADVFGGHASQVFVTPSSQESVLVRQLSFSENEIMLGIRPQLKGLPQLIARLGHIGGPILSVHAIDEFSVFLTTERKFSVSSTYPDGTRVGNGGLVLTPWIRDLDIKMWVQTSGVTFLDGATELYNSSNAFETYGQDNAGIYPFSIVLPPSLTSHVCHGYRVMQNEYRVSK